MAPNDVAANTIKLIVLAGSHRGCKVNATDCVYIKLPPEDEQFIYSKHVEDIYWNKFKKKVHLVGSYYANMCMLRNLHNNLCGEVYHMLLFFHVWPTKQLTVTRAVVFHENVGLPCIRQKGELITVREKYSVIHTL